VRRTLLSIAAGLAVLVPAAPAAATPGTLRVGFSDDSAMRAYPASASVAVDAGFSFARVFIGWSDIATRRPARPRDPNDPAYDWSAVDANLAPYAGSHLEIIGQLWLTPSWASGNLSPKDYPLAPADFEDFAYAAALRYPQIHTWMPVNEPNNPTSVERVTIAAYEPMLRAAYAGIKSAAPGAAVVAGPLARWLGNPTTDAWLWATRLVQDGVPMDAFAVNPYPEWNLPMQERSASRIDIWDLPALARLVGVPVIVGEFGWTTEIVSESQQAAWLADAIRVARCTPGLASFTIWGFHDHPQGPGDPPGNDTWGHYGLLRADGAPKPSLAAVEQAMREPLDCVAVGAAAGAPIGWTPLAEADVVQTAREGPVGVLARAAAGSSATGGKGASQLDVSDAFSRALAIARAGPLSLPRSRPQLLRVAWVARQWRAIIRVRTPVAASARVEQLRKGRPSLLVRRILPPRALASGIRRVPLGRGLPRDRLLVVRVICRAANGSSVTLARSFVTRVPGAAALRTPLATVRR
jgi:hypothetical protein